MNKIGILMMFLLMTLFSFAQNANETNKVDLSKIKTLESKQDFKEEVIIKKPDNSSLMARKETDSTVDMRIDIKEKIKKSNKLLY
jgi:hypothetical protein